MCPEERLAVRGFTLIRAGYGIIIRLLPRLLQLYCAAATVCDEVLYRMMMCFRLGVFQCAGPRADQCDRAGPHQR
jgi:hypothetical protein